MLALFRGFPAADPTVSERILQLRAPKHRYAARQRSSRPQFGPPVPGGRVWQVLDRGQLLSHLVDERKARQLAACRVLHQWHAEERPRHDVPDIDARKLPSEFSSFDRSQCATRLAVPSIRVT